MHKAEVTLLLHMRTEIDVSVPFQRPSDKDSAFEFHSARTGIGTKLLMDAPAHISACSVIQQQ